MAASALHPALVQLVRREFARLHADQTARARGASVDTGATSDDAAGAAAAASYAVGGTSEAIAASVPPSAPAAVQPAAVLTLASLLRLSAPPGLPLDFRHLATLWALDRERRGAASEDDLLALVESATARARHQRWTTKPWTMRAKLRAAFLADMYAEVARAEQAQEATSAATKENTGDSTTPPAPVDSPSSVPFVQWVLSLLVHVHPTSSFVHVGLRVLYLHRESIELLWELLRPFFPRPPLTAALAAHSTGDRTAHAADRELGDAPRLSFHDLCAISPSFASVTGSSALATHSFQSFFDLLQHTAERAGLLALDDEVLDHFVPLAIVEQMLAQIDLAMRRMMQRVGFEEAPSEHAAKLERKAAAVAAAAAREQQKPVPTAARTHMKHPSLALDGELFTMLAAPTPRSFVTPRAHLSAAPHMHQSPSKRATLDTTRPAVATSITHRLRNIIEEERLGGGSPFFDVEGTEAEAADGRNVRRSLEKDIAVPPSTVIAGSGNSSSRFLASATPELLTPTSSHRGMLPSMKRPPGIPSLSFAPQRSDQPQSGHIGGMSGPRSANTTLHSHSSSMPSFGFSLTLPLTASSSGAPTSLSIASTTLQPNSGVAPSSAGSSQPGSTQQTPLTSPNGQTYQAHLNAVANSRRSTGPLPPRFTQPPQPQTTNHKGVPCLPLQSLGMPPASPLKMPISGLGSPLSSPYTYTQRPPLMQQHSLPSALSGHAQLMTPHRVAVAGSMPYTPHRSLQMQLAAAGPGSGPQTPSTAHASQVLPSFQAHFDGPLPAAHASLLSSASKLTAHVHHVHDLATLTERAVRQLVRDGLDSDDEDAEHDMDQEIMFERSIDLGQTDKREDDIQSDLELELELALKADALRLQARAQAQAQKQIASVVPPATSEEAAAELHRRKAGPRAPAVVTTAAKVTPLAPASVAAPTIVAAVTAPKSSPARRDTLSGKKATGALSRQSSASSPGGSRMSSPSPSRRPSVVAIAGAPASLLANVTVKAPLKVAPPKLSKTAPKLVIPGSSAAPTGARSPPVSTNPHPFGASNSPDTRAAAAFAAQMRTPTKEHGPPQQDDMITPARKPAAASPATLVK